MTLSHHRAGAGDPLVLIHGIGSHWQVWEPVLAALEAEREVIAVDLPGFGGSAPLPAGTEPEPGALALAVAAFLDDLGVGAVHVAGNSLGGWIALELVRIGRARSACALSPAGFWNRWEMAYGKASLRMTRATAVRVGDRAERLYASPAVRRVAFAQIMAHPERLPAAAAAASTRNLAASPGWEATLDAICRRRFSHGEALPATVTVAWGERDRLLLRRQAERARSEVPRARHVVLRGCGHVPTWDDPDLVARAILTSG